MPENEALNTKDNAKNAISNRAPITEANFDTSKDEENLQALEAELNESRSAVENNFIEEYTAIVENSEDLQNLFFDNRKQFFKEYEKAKQSFLEEQIMPKLQKIEDLKQNINDKKRNGNIFKVKSEFEKANPNVNLQQLDDFYSNDLPKRIQNEIAQMPALEGYNKILELYNQNNTQAKNTLPKNYNSLYMDENTNLNDTEIDLPMNRY